MASTKAIQMSFAGGEISENMYGRQDDQKYQTGLARCLNFIVLPQGPVQNRPGFSFVRAAKYSDRPVRLIPFRFNNKQTMIIELGDKYARFHTLGATLLGEDGEPYEIETPWAADDLFSLHYVQSNDVLTFVHNSYPPKELKRYSLTDWRVETPNFGLKLGTPANVKAERKTEAASDSNADKYTFQYKVSALNSDKTEEGAASEAVSVTANLYATGTTVQVSWDAVPDATFYRVYKNQGGLYGYIGDTEELSIIDDGIDPKTDITPRRLDDVFQTASGIKDVTVESGGSGYVYHDRGIQISAGFNASRPTKRESCSLGKGQGAPADTLKKLNYTPSSATSGEPIWQRTSHSSSNYPAYPDAEAIKAAALERIELVDLSGPGSGGELSVEFDVSYSRNRVDSSSDSGGSDYYSSTTVRIKSITVKTPGSRYVSPAIRAYWTLSVLVFVTAHRYTYEIGVQTSGITLSVSDTTGSGAELVPVVQNGVITDVIIKSSGQNYTDPTISVVSDTGSGAVLKAEVDVGGNYPSAVGYFEQRKCFAGMSSDPQSFVMTCTGSETDMSYSLPYKDDDQVYARLASNEFDGIEHIVSLGQMLLLTSGSVAVISTKNDDAITPDSVNAVVQSSVGASTVRPLVVNNVVLYVGSQGGHVWELGYQYEKGGYIPGDLSLRSTHLFDFKDIVDSAQSRSPQPIMWFVSTDGSLLGLTYIPEQAIGAWHQHTTDGTFESCASVIEDGEDHLYCVVRREINGQVVRYIERMNTRKIERLENAIFVDCAGQYVGPETTEISGLTWLEGKNVSILADGAVRPQQLVTNGKITLDSPASIVQVGLPYTSDIKTLPVTIQTPGYGSANTKNVSRAFLRLKDSSGVFAGPSFDEADLVEHKQRTTEQPGQPPALVSGIVDLQLYGKWSDSGSICLRQSNPLPLEVLSLTLEVSV